MGRPTKPDRLKSSAFVGVRMTTRLKADVCREAKRDDMEVSEWVRMLLVTELSVREGKRMR